MNSPHANETGPREACGVFGIVAPRSEQEPTSEIAKSVFFALFALQHRGQESAGIGVMGPGGIRAHKGMGLVTQVFTERDLAPLSGHLAIGHVRYSTAGTSNLHNAQPYVIHTGAGPLALAHNGNLTNARMLRRILHERGVGLVSESDSELLTQLLAAGQSDWTARIENMMQLAEGAYSLVLMTADAIYAVRDCHGFRPLYLGRLPATADGGGDGWVVASESCAFGPIGAKVEREVEPGEIVRLSSEGITSRYPPLLQRRRSFCSFEYVYFARPDSLVEGQLVHVTRQRMGEILARESPADADIVIGVPDSALPAALGFSRESGIPYGEGLIKNRYIGRTFIQPTPEQRRSGVRLKFNPLSANLRGRRVVLVDDSIVRGTTAGPIVELLRQGGATEVHVRISSPPVRHPCYMGVDMPHQQDLVASRLDPEGIAELIGADSLAYLSHDGMMEAIHRGLDDSERRYTHCAACFTGDYPLEIRDLAARDARGGGRDGRG